MPGIEEKRPGSWELPGLSVKERNGIGTWVERRVTISVAEVIFLSDSLVGSDHDPTIRARSEKLSFRNVKMCRVLSENH